MSSTSSPSLLLSYFNHFGNDTGGHVHAAPRGNMIMRWLYNFVAFPMYLCYWIVQYGQHQEAEETDLRDIQQVETPEASSSAADEETSMSAAIEAHETKISILKKVLNAISTGISISTTGVFGFLQLSMGNQRADQTLKLIYMACNVSLCGSFIIAILGVFITSIIHCFQRKTLILYVIIGVSIVFAILDFALVMAFNLLRG